MMEFQILLALAGEFQSRLDKLNEKCEKYNNPKLTFSILEQFKENNQEWIKINLDGCVPKVGEYSLVGVISRIENNHLIKCVPGKEIPESFRSNTFFCDHCGVNRYRAEVVIVQNEQGEYKQLGKTCLKDYLGISLEHLVNQFTWIGELVDDCSDFDKSPRARLVVSPEHYLTMVSLCVRKLGYISSAKANDTDAIPTRSTAWHLVYPYPNFQKHWIEAYELYVEDCDIELAKQALDWAKNLPDTTTNSNNFFSNVKALANCTYVESKNCGYLAAIIPCYEKHLGIIREQAKPKEIVENNWIGEPKKRIELDVKCVFTRTYDSQYGTGTLVKFVNYVPSIDGKPAQENVLTWFASGLVDYELDTQYRIKFTVKKHDTYEGKKQTLVSRVKNIILTEKVKVGD